MKTAIVWFKTNLRVHDNEPLLRAIEQNDLVIPVYCFDDNHYRTTEKGFKKTGSFRAQFILQALLDLDSSLRQLGSGLLIVKGNTGDVLAQIALEYKARKIYAQQEVAHEELQTQDEVTTKLQAIHCSLETFNTTALYHPHDLPFTIANVPDIFTPFRHKVESSTKIRAPFPSPKAIRSLELPALQLPSLSDLGLGPAILDSRAAFNYPGGESSAMMRVKYYFEESGLVSSYKATRNGLVGADYSTKFSPWLAIGCLSPRYVYQKLKAYEANYGANDSTYWVVFELLWRDYFRLIMSKYGVQLFLKNGIDSNHPKAKQHNTEVFAKWINGETGVDFVDANMRELKLTGFMSNRGRQNVASYLCNDLKLDWTYGAAYFEVQLIDYDVCSNWGNWAYIAGVGNDPRKDRYFNIQKQADQYDTDHSYRNLWLK
ncbi:cryptochrome DASH [Flavipsychrobacter stenotrophus]|uniref:Cryptochrome DASH n=1 Tax=Flavipsychrobacter stenotrophus TaxID=2077091 RepID=A0A2S7SQP2_9BACT|nr:cryptochrome DASH [Flavipsychrobacter stenotrophus]